MKRRLGFLMLLITACIFWSCKPEAIEPVPDGGVGGEIIGGVDSVLQVHTVAASYVWSTSAVLGGNMSINTLSGIQEVGIMYLPTGGADVDSLYFESHSEDIVKQSASMGKSWSIAVSGLIEETEYAYRAYVFQSDGSYCYGEVLHFITTAAGSDNGEIYSGEVAGDQGMADYYESGDNDYYENSTFGNLITVYYEDNDVTVNDPSGQAVITKDGAYLTLNLESNGMSGVEVRVSGRSANGDLKLYSGSKFKLTLAGVTLISQRGAAINNQSSKRTFVHLMEGKVNKIEDAKSWTNEVSSEDCKATLFSEGQLVFSGAGILCVSGQSKHGISSDDYVRVRPGSTLVIEKSAKDGVHTNDGVTIDGGLLQITASSDGVQVDKGVYKQTGGKVVINSVDDGIVSSYSESDASISSGILITGGDININTTGVKAHGLKSSTTLVVNSGSMRVGVTGNASKCLKSDGDIEINGGELTLQTSGNAYYENNDTYGAACIKGDANVVINGGTIYAQSSGTGGKGISVDGKLTINDGIVNIQTSGGKYTYSSRQTCSPKGIKSDGNILIAGGMITVNVTGRSDGSEGIESKSRLEISGGEVVVNAYDDGMNASSEINISGGKVYSYSENNDGIDSNGTISISGGLVIGVGTRTPEEGFDCDNNTFKITGGILIGMGGATSNPTASVCTQYTIIQSINAQSGSIMHLASSDGTPVVTFKFPRTLSSACMLISAPQIGNGTYVYKTGGSCSGSEWNGYYENGSYSGGTQVASVTVSSIVTGASSGGPGGGGGRP